MSNDPLLASSPAPGGFAARVGTALLIVSLFVVVVLALWNAAQVLLLFFAAMLLAVLLRTAAHPVSRWTKLSTRWSLTLVLVLLLVFTVAAGWLAAPKVTEQFMELRDSVLESIGSLADRLDDTPVGNIIEDRVSEITENTNDKNRIWKKLGGIFSTTFGAVAGILVFLISSIFLAYNPRLYLAGIIRLVPLARRARTCEVFTALGHTLQGWLIGQAISMVFLFATTWIMLALLGMPLAFILALVTGLATFVPYIGPLLALVPILLVAFVEDPMLAVYTGGLYMVIQNVEANVLMPLIFQRTVHLPPALTIAGQLILGGIFGVLGFILATPLTAVAMVLAQKLYVEDVLGDAMENEVEDIPKLPNSS
jgi:predicted PurR-regulated permease PerM